MREAFSGFDRAVIWWPDLRVWHHCQRCNRAHDRLRVVLLLVTCNSYFGKPRRCDGRKCSEPPPNTRCSRDRPLAVIQIRFLRSSPLVSAQLSRKRFAVAVNLERGATVCTDHAGSEPKKAQTRHDRHLHDRRGEIPHPKAPPVIRRRGESHHWVRSR